VDVRILAATNKDLERGVREKTFREDLYYRLNVIPIHMPPLRERREDIPVLADHFLARSSESTGKKIGKISDETMEHLVAYDWPGNVRELMNVIERAVALETAAVVLPERLPDKIREFGRADSSFLPPPEGPSIVPDEGIDFGERVASLERDLLRAAMDKAGGVQTKAARLLRMNLRSFRYLLQKYGLR
jgi:two-component system response regulator PilR (NtrC family)